MERHFFIKKVICILVAFAMLLTLFAGCNGSENKNSEKVSTEATAANSATVEKTEELPPLEYSYYRATDETPTFMDVPEDKITPYVEKKFNIKVSKVLYNQGLSFKERMNMFIASNDLPDVIMAGGGDALLVKSTGRYAETGDLIKQNMPNLLRWCPESNWSEALYNGRMYSVPCPLVDANQFEELKNDIYNTPMANWSYWIRESILKKLGYSFTPLKEIEKKINETGQKPTLEDYKVEPAISTPDDFYNLLKKIKALNIKVGDLPLIPFTTPHALQLHMGNMFGISGYWRYDSDKNDVYGWLDSPYAKEYYQFLNKLYKEGLIDKDFSVQQPEQIQEKVASGRVACGTWIPDAQKARDALKKMDPEEELHPMLLPQKAGIKPVGIDHVSPVFFQMFINKDFKDIPRLMKYFDWFLSDEGMLINQWGTEDLGIYEMKDGKRVFKDNTIYESLVKGEAEKGTTAFEKYYKYGISGSSSIKNKAFYSAPWLTGGYNPVDWKRSYPFKVVDIYGYSWAIVTNQYLDFSGVIFSGINDLTNKPAGWWWGEFSQNKSPKLFAAKNDNEFNKNWDEIYKEFMDKNQYADGKKEMISDFKMRGFMK